MRHFTRKLPSRRTVAVASSLTLLLTGPAGLTPAQASLQTEMADMFKASGMMANDTPPNVYHSQSSNIAALGGLQVRTPVQNYQMMSYDLPSMKAGCGGVDLRLGSFSWINTEKFKQMLQQIGNNSVGLLFSAAISTITPLIGGKIEMLLKQVQDASNFFSNTCRSAEMALDGLMGKKTADTYSACMKVQRLFAKDEEEARTKCQDQAPDVNQAAASDSNPAVRAVAQRDVNLIWDALKKTKLTHEQRELYMNVTGTVIVRAKRDSSGDTNQTIPPVLDSLNVLERGNTTPPTSAQPGDVAIAGWWSCDEDADPECLNPKNTTTKVFTPFAQQAFNRMTALLNALWNNKEPSISDQNFVNYSSLPIGMMLRVGYMSRRDDLARSLTNRYADVIGYDFAYNFLSRSILDAKVYLANGAHRRGVEDIEVDNMISRMDALINQLEGQRHIKATDNIGMSAMVTNIVDTERQMYATLPQGLQNMMTFSNHMSALRGR